MRVSNIFKTIPLKNKMMASVCLISIALGNMIVLDKKNVDVIKEEQALISEMTNKTLNISFVPNNSSMKNDINLFSPINDNDISNIAKIQGVKSVKPMINEFNPLSGYAKINNQSSYIELYGMDEKGQDLNKENVEMLYGRTINANDIGKNVIVLNMETVNSMQIADAKSLIGTGLEINGSVYEVIGIMNVVVVDARDNTNELQHSSLIPKSTSKEVMSRANSSVGIYSSITVQVEEGYNTNAVESSIYNLLYDSHENINGYYERDSEYSLPKKLGPTITILDNFLRLSNVLTYGLIMLAIASVIKIFGITNKRDAYTDNDENEAKNKEDDNKEDNNKEDNNEEDNNEEDNNEEDVKLEDEVEIKEDDIQQNGQTSDESNEDLKDGKDSLKKTSILKNELIKNIAVLIFGFGISYLLTLYYLLDRNMSDIFNIALLSKVFILFISIYLITLREESTEE